MTKWLRRLFFFGLLFEGLGAVRLPVLLTALTAALALVVCAHLVSIGKAGSA